MSTSASDHDISDASNSPYSHHILYSPHNSPSQQVPNLASDLMELSCTDNQRQFLKNANKPALIITEQPQNHFRFRYVSEMVGTHGCLLGKSSAPNKPKTHPTVELVNYSGKALIKCYLVEHNCPEEHPHKLLEDEQDKDMSYLVPDQGSYKVAFGGIGIIHTAKKDVPAFLFKKFSEKYKNKNVKDLQVQCENMAKSINLNIVRLKFSAVDVNTGQEICDSVFSDPIHNMKSAATNDLKICRMSRSSGTASGNEDLFLFVEKVNKKNIIIRFFELDENGKRVWSDDAHFMQSDVHHQYGIVCWTPPYKDVKTPVDVNVFIELVRPSDGRTSEPKEFKYKANQAYRQIKKRKAGSSLCSIGSSSSGSLTSGCDIPISVVNHQQAMVVDSNAPANPPIFTLPQIKVATSSNDCDLASALYSAPGSECSPSPMSSPMWSQPHSVIPPEPIIADLHLNSADFEQIVNNNIENQVPEEMRHFLNEYMKSYGESLPEEKNSMEFIRSLLVADSGRPKKEIKTEHEEETKMNMDETNDEKKPNTDYTAFYKTDDGVEVKKLVKELCVIMRNSKGFKKSEVKTCLEKLFAIRLSNGDTFLHMSLCSNQSSLEYILKIIHSVKATHLLDCVNDKQQTTLHLAIANDMPKMVALLIATGSNPMLKDVDDLNAIHYAVKYNSCLEVLLEAIKKHGVPCDLNDFNGEQQSALHMAVVRGQAGSTRALLQHGAAPSSRDPHGRTPLHLAATYDDRLAVMPALLQYIPSSEIDIKDDFGNTALHIVCGGPSIRENTVKIAKLLLDKQAYPLKREDSNQSAWQLVQNKPALKELMKSYIDVESSMEYQDIKSEPEDEFEFESADEGDLSESGLQELEQYSREVSLLVDGGGAWRELARRLQLDAMLAWFAAQPSPTLALLHTLAESRHDITSKSLALTLEIIGQTEAASIIRRHIDC